MSDRLRKAAQAALRDIEVGNEALGYNLISTAALRAALAEPEPQGEPVAWFVPSAIGGGFQTFYAVNYPTPALARADAQLYATKYHYEVGTLFAAPPSTVPREVAERMAEALAGIADTVPGDGWLPQGIQEAYRATARKALAAYREAVR